ncbi:MAG: hypothetical protein ABIA74_01500 [bacterium]
MKYVDFKLPDKLGQPQSFEYFISQILTDKNGFKIVFHNNKDDKYDIVFDFGGAVMDYRVSDEGRRLDHHVDEELTGGLVTEAIDSEYLKKLDEEAEGILLAINPDLKHYIAGDQDYCVDIISRAEPKVYKVKSKK